MPVGQAAEPSGAPRSPGAGRIPPRTSSARPSTPQPPGTPRPAAAPRRVGSAPPAAARAATPPHGTPRVRTAGAARPAAAPAAPGVRAGAGTPPSGGPRPPGGSGPHGPGTPGRPGRLRLRRGRIVALVLSLVLLLVLAWPIGLLLWADGKITHVTALSGAADTAGTTYLLAGSDSRDDGAINEDGTEGARTDTIMLLHEPESGPTALISLPRDAYTDVPGHGPAKLNAAYAWGGPELLVASVEGLTGFTIDHYVEIGLGGVQGVVNAVGGVELCLDYDVNDKRSGLKWKSGCHTVKGKKALAFIRMRYADPEGDIGRAERQRQLVSKLVKQVASPGVLVNPAKQVSLIDAGLSSVAVDDDTGIIDMGRLALAFRAAGGPEGITGAPPIASLDYRPGGVGSTVLLDPDEAPGFFADIMAGSLPAGKVGEE
ncbi:hypothetical protein GCM10011331_25970 [Flavimobilis marinus]|nr:hypothetical protein GCM10011331_25970 [Flavimobilis marinus]